MNIKLKRICLFVISFFTFCSGSFSTSYAQRNILPSNLSGIKSGAAPHYALQSIYDKRCHALFTGQTSELKHYFDLSQRKGTDSLDHEVRRVKYLNNWAKARGIKFTNIYSRIRIKKTYYKDSRIIMELHETYKFDYIYPRAKKASLNSFGVGIRHNVTMTKKGDRWVIYNDDYTDCFEDALSSYTIRVSQPIFSFQKEFKNALNTDAQDLKPSGYINGKYNRYMAVKYADKYCGAAWGSSNNYKYNSYYKDYSGIGGDCTNYASQILGDKNAGGLPFTSTWYYRKYKRQTSISKTWINANAFKNYILKSGTGKLVKKGTFRELVTPSKEFPYGAIAKLKVGDLICYEKKGHVDHFAVVTGRDSLGYTLINSHTTDRFHVPWDLGWGDKWIKFYLIHIRD